MDADHDALEALAAERGVRVELRSECLRWWVPMPEDESLSDEHDHVFCSQDCLDDWNDRGDW